MPAPAADDITVNDPVSMLHRRLRTHVGQRRTEHRAVWGGTGVFLVALVGMQPVWQSGVVGLLLVLTALAATALRFAMTDDNLRAITAVSGHGLVGQAVTHSVELAHRWSLAGHLQPAWA
jgi:hypothetical protein